MGCEGELSRAMTEELIDQWMQHFPLIYQTDSPLQWLFTANYWGYN